MTTHYPVLSVARLCGIVACAALIAMLAIFVPRAHAGMIVADSGFRPNPDGFSFENYGEGYAGLNAAELQRMFGDDVCLGYAKNGNCILTPTARMWMRLRNKGMEGGHCYGFAVLSELINKGQLKRFGYESIFDLGGGPMAFDLPLDGNVRLQRSIARAFAFQAYPVSYKVTFAGTPTQVLHKLIGELRPDNPESWTFAIYKPDMSGGHAITPYAVEDMGGGIYEVHVYDNNWPDDANRRLRINTNNDTWSYFAAINPNEKEWLYEGDTKTKTLEMIPTTPQLGKQPCPFCLGRRGWNSKYNTVTLDSGDEEHAHLLITDNKGRKTGYLPNGKFVNEIPGVKVTPRTSGGVRLNDDGTELVANSLEPIYRIPAATQVRILVDGRHLTERETQGLTVIGPSFDATSRPIVLYPGQVASYRIDPRHLQYVMRPSPATKNPSVAFAAEDKHAAYRIKVEAHGAKAGKAIRIRPQVKRGRLWIDDTRFKRRLYSVTVDSFGAKRHQLYRGFYLRRHQRAYLDYTKLGNPKRDRAWIVITKPGGKKIKRIPLRKRF